VNGQRLRKEILLDGVKRHANDVIGHFNAVIFVPQMSQIIEGGPDERRRYLNLALAQTVPAYARVLSEYSQALTQRNALLKALNENGGNSNQLQVWDEALVKFGAQIILWRIQAVQEIERLASRIHHELTRGTEILRFSYEPAFDPLPKPNGQLGLKLDTAIDRSSLELNEIQDGFLARLKEIRGEEIARGVTTIGPHRDDLRFIINKADVSDYGSRGQIRTTLLALKLAEVEWMKERTGEYPCDPARRSDGGTRHQPPRRPVEICRRRLTTGGVVHHHRPDLVLACRQFGRFSNLRATGAGWQAFGDMGGVGEKVRRRISLIVACFDQQGVAPFQIGIV
jgi:DNA replication and repair protein RecF